MERLRKFLALSWGDRCFLLAVALLLGGVGNVEDLGRYTRLPVLELGNR